MLYDVRTSVSSPADSLGGTGESLVSDQTRATVPSLCPPAAEEEAEARGGGTTGTGVLGAFKGIEEPPVFSSNFVCQGGVALVTRRGGRTWKTLSVGTKRRLLFGAAKGQPEPLPWELPAIYPARLQESSGSGSQSGPSSVSVSLTRKPDTEMHRVET